MFDGGSQNEAHGCSRGLRGAAPPTFHGGSGSGAALVEADGMMPLRRGKRISPAAVFGGGLRAWRRRRVGPVSVADGLPME